jgi:phosphoribosylformylglycinamidine cyclo-ligase
VPPLFTFLAEAGRVPPDEMDRVFNLGVGMIAVAPVGTVAALRAAAAGAGVETWVVGEVVAGDGVRIAR